MRIRLFIALSLVVTFVRFLSAEDLPPRLEMVAEASVARLAALYDVPLSQAQLPMDIRLVTGDRVPADWLGVPAHAAGIARPASSSILVFIDRAGNFPFGDTAQTLRHEISHVLLYRGLGFHPPRWLDEGLAVRFSGRWETERRRTMNLPLAELTELLGSFDISNREAYRAAHDAVDILVEDEEIPLLIRLSRQAGSVERGYFQLRGVTPDEALARHRGSWLGRITSFVTLIPDALWPAAALIAIAGAVVLRRRRRKRLDQMPLDDQDPGWK